MKTKLSPLLVLVPLALGVAGCSSSDSAPATAEQKKAFGGSAPPADYMSGIKTAPQGAPKK